jgi:16S rRNA (cytidine1402-2'-O)-methyltransferase
MSKGKLYLIPSVLHEDAVQTIPAYVVDAIKKCDVFFVETEKNTRRFFKKIWKEMVIDDYQWFTIHKAEESVKSSFLATLNGGKNIGIVSDAGCPGIADPGQILIELAQAHQIVIEPLVGPSSILLALMASGMNGQNFHFHGYLPIDGMERKKKIKELEAESAIKKTTHIFIETPYRNNQLMSDIMLACKPTTSICVGVDITGPSEKIQTKTVNNWSKQLPELHKIPTIFLLQA